METAGLTRERIQAMSSAERLELLARLALHVIELEPAGQVTVEAVRAMSSTECRALLALGGPDG